MEIIWIIVTLQKKEKKKKKMLRLVLVLTLIVTGYEYLDLQIMTTFKFCFLPII